MPKGLHIVSLPPPLSPGILARQSDFLPQNRPLVSLKFPQVKNVAWGFPLPPGEGNRKLYEPYGGEYAGEYWGKKEGDPGFSRNPLVFLGGPSGVRTRAAAVRGRCPGPLDDGTVMAEEPGFEPGKPGPEPGVMPFHHSSTERTKYPRGRPPVKSQCAPRRP